MIERKGSMKQILVGVDRSAGAANAVRWACALASRCGAAVVVMTGFEPTDSEMPPGRLETLVAREQQELAAWLETLPPGGVPMRTVVELGDPRTGILTVA